MKKILLLILLSISCVMADPKEDILGVVNNMTECYNRDPRNGLINFGLAVAQDTTSVLKMLQYIEESCPREYKRINLYLEPYSDKASRGAIYLSISLMLKNISRNLLKKADDFETKANDSVKDPI